MATWPVSLPTKFLMDGYEEKPPVNIVEHQMDVGPPAARRRSTAGVTKIQGVLSLTSAQVTTLLNFFYSDLQSGVVKFTWVHPRTQAAADLRIVSIDSITPFGVNYRAVLMMIFYP